MAVFTLVYSCILNAVMVLSAACCYYMYRREGNKNLLVSAILMLVYMVDNMVVLCTEYIPAFSLAYDQSFLHTPATKTVYFLCVAACALYLFYNTFAPGHGVACCAVWCVYLAVMVCLPMVPSPQKMMRLYYVISPLLLVMLSAWGIYALEHKRVTDSSLNTGVVKKALYFTVIMNLMIIVEDSLVISFWDTYQQSGLNIYNRNWSENIFFLGVAVFFMYHTMVRLKRLDELEREKISEGGENSDRQSDEFAVLFGQRYLLTEREQEILELLLEGVGPQEISSTLTIALGTVKTHVHNIYQKTGVTKRSQLMAEYQRYRDAVLKERAEIIPQS